MNASDLSFILAFVKAAFDTTRPAIGERVMA